MHSKVYLLCTHKTQTHKYTHSHSPDSMYNMVFRMEIAFEVGAR